MYICCTVLGHSFDFLKSIFVLNFTVSILAKIRNLVFVKALLKKEKIGLAVTRSYFYVEILIMFGTFRDSAELSWGLSLTALPIDKLYSQSGKVFRLPWELNLLLPCFVFAQTVHPACRYCTVLYCRGQLGSIWEKKRHPPPLFLSRCTYSMALPLKAEYCREQRWDKLSTIKGRVELKTIAVRDWVTRTALSQNYIQHLQYIHTVSMWLMWQCHENFLDSFYPCI